jgi:hypothetical protein
MLRMLRRAAILASVTASAISAQTSSPADVSGTTMQDSATLNAVTEFSVRSGKLALSSAANPGPVYMPDGTYTNQADLIIVIFNGHITRVQESSGGITEISSIRLNRQRVIRLTPSTNALMAVSDMPLPSGTFKSADGQASFTIVYGRPTAFTLSAKSDQK